MLFDEERLERGRENFRKCYGGVIDVPQGQPDAYQETTLGLLFADIWPMEPLSFRDKRLLVLGVLAGSGADPSLFEIHVRSALKNGEISPADLRTAIITILPYCGYPKTSPLYMLSEKIIKEHEAKG